MTDQNGNDRYSTECVLRGFDAKLLMLDARTAGDAGPSSADSRQPDSRSYATAADDLDDDIPF